MTTYRRCLERKRGS